MEVLSEGPFALKFYETVPNIPIISRLFITPFPMREE